MQWNTVHSELQGLYYLSMTKCAKKNTAGRTIFMKTKLEKQVWKIYYTFGWQGVGPVLIIKCTWMADHSSTFE